MGIKTDFIVNAPPQLPSEIATREGVKFDPRSNDWVIGGLARRRRFKFDDFVQLSPSVVNNLKWALLIQLQERSFSHADNLYSIFLYFYRSVIAQLDHTCSRLELSHILSFKAQLNEATIWKLGVIRILLDTMHKTGFGIASTEAVEYLSSATIRGNIKGTSIRTRDPEKGAFSDHELLSIQSALNNAYANGEVDIYSFAVAWLFLAYGCRPIQIASMKEKDLIVVDQGDSCSYALQIPRAKQRGQVNRDAFKTRYCGKQVGTLLRKVIEHNKGRRTALGLQEGEAPLFIAKRIGKLPELQYHWTSQDIRVKLEKLISRITGLKANTKRFRITLAQRAVDDGKDKFTVAELLDHSDTQNVGVYYEASPALVLRLDRHLAMEMAPLAQAFAGVVVETEAEARRGSDRASRIYDRSIADNVSEALGTCGQMSFCGLAVPFACYTCRHFQPWIDGPHEEFLGALISDRERMQAEEYSPKIFSIRDRTILAVAEVIQLCESQRELRADASA